MHNDTSPLVSIVMAAYNEEQFIDKAIDSIISQTYKNWELIIIDDCSKDRTPEIIQSYSKETRIHCIRHRENKGVTISLNDGIDAANGTYIARMDADDISMPQRIERQVNFLRGNSKYAFVGTGAIIIDENGNKLFKIMRPADDVKIKKILHFRNIFIHGSIIFDADKLKSVGSYDTRIKKTWEDYELFLRLSNRYPIANLSDLLYCWRNTSRGESNLSKGEYEERTQLVKKVFELKMSGTAEELETLYKKFNEHYIKTAVLNQPSESCLRSRYLRSIIRSCVIYGISKKRTMSYLVELYKIERMNLFILISYTMLCIPSLLRKSLLEVVFRIFDIDNGVRAYSK